MFSKNLNPCKPYTWENNNLIDGALPLQYGQYPYLQPHCLCFATLGDIYLQPWHLETEFQLNQWRMMATCEGSQRQKQGRQSVLLCYVGNFGLGLTHFPEIR